jgi:hypothetical protein
LALYLHDVDELIAAIIAAAGLNPEVNLRFMRAEANEYLARDNKRGHPPGKKGGHFVSAAGTALVSKTVPANFEATFGTLKWRSARSAYHANSRAYGDVQARARKAMGRGATKSEGPQALAD